jgi:hypothetical protein
MAKPALFESRPGCIELREQFLLIAQQPQGDILFRLMAAEVGGMERQIGQPATRFAAHPL